jgi:hypothetical protein
MARYGAAFSKTTSAAAGPIVNLVNTANADARVWEIGVFAETAVSGTIGLVRATGAGTTPGGNVAAVAEDTQSGATTTSLFTTYATEPTQATVYVRRAVLPATIGAGIIWTFPMGIFVPSGTAVGLLLRQLSTAAVTYSVYMAFDAA